MIASAGRLMAAGPRFLFQPVHVTTALVDVAATRMIRARTGSFQPDLTDHHDNEVVCPFKYPDLEPEIPKVKLEPWESSAPQRRGIPSGVDPRPVRLPAQEPFLGLCRQPQRRGRLLGHLLPRLADGRNGRQGPWARAVPRGSLVHSPHPADRRSAPGGRHLLHCVYQATRNSSQTTRNAAATVAEGIGASMSYLEIDELVEGYIRGVEKILGRQLSWGTDDLALQNIQARVRAPSVWLLANVNNALLLSTSNRSEAAVGYATMDGDTAGGLSPIAGIDKAFLRRWLRWLEREGPVGLHPVPALAVVNNLAPTAELRPLENKQTDEDDLMPYEVLDPIERAAIRDKQTPVEVFRLMRSQFPQYSTAQLHLWVERFFRLWARNQWKRERYAPSFHVDDENLDPKTWCRFPILSGGFKRELEELQAYVKRGK